MRTVFMRRGEVFSWLGAEYGLRYRQVRCLLESGVIEARYLPGPGGTGGRRRALYCRGQIERDVVGALVGAGSIAAGGQRNGGVV